MALANWPSTLPQKFEPQGFTLLTIPNTLRTEPDLGPVRARRRSTLTLYRISGTIQLTKAQWDSFNSFYVVSLAGGVRQFHWVHPYDENDAVTMRFLEDPRDSLLGTLAFRVKLDLEMTV